MLCGVVVVVVVHVDDDDKTVGVKLFLRSYICSKNLNYYRKRIE